MAKALVKKKADSVAEIDAEFEGFDGAGLENVERSDLLIPRLTILQQLSPQLNSKKVEFIEGGKVGDICDVGMGELFPDGLVFLPVYWRKDYLEWAPRSTGKGLVNIHPDDSILAETTPDEKGRPFLASGNLVVETAQFFGYNVTAGMRPCFIPMASTQLKKSRKWLTLASGEKLKRGDGSEFTAPLFYRTYMLTTAEESNNEGEWSGWKVERGQTLRETCDALGVDFTSTMTTVRDFYEMLVKGEAKADPTQYDDGETINASAQSSGEEKM